MNLEIEKEYYFFVFFRVQKAIPKNRAIEQFREFEQFLKYQTVSYEICSNFGKSDPEKSGCSGCSGLKKISAKPRY